MKASRKRPKGAYRWSFGLLLCGSVLMPNSIGYQDLAALIARQPAVTERWRSHVRSSAFGTIHATFNFARPIGSSIPDPYFTQLAALDPRALDVTGSVPLPSPIEPQIAAPRYDFPVVQRRLKGDRLPLAKTQPPLAPEKSPTSQPQKLKDQASLTPEPKPAPLPADIAADEQQPVTPLARKGDGSAPAPAVSAPAPAVVVAPALVARPPADSPVHDAALKRAAANAEKIARTVQKSGSTRKKPAAVAQKPVPAATPERDSAIERAATRAEQIASSMAAAAAIQRKPAPVAQKPASFAEKATSATPHSMPPLQQSAKSAPSARPAGDVALDRAADLSDRVAQTAEAAASIQRKPAEVAVIPARAPETEISDLESERADVHGPLQLPAVPVAEAPGGEPETKAAETLPAEPEAPKQADRFRIVDSLAQFQSPGPQATRIYFGTHEIGFGKGTLQRWEPDEAPTVLAPPHVDREIKRAALDPSTELENETPGVTVAPKGEVTGEGQRPRTPAERLELSGASRIKHEKCLANAIYFEARGEVERGQMAVAQVILNRAFSGYYPGTVCDVVYQNAHRHLACQFTFACDNVRDVVKDQKAWAIATRIAGEALDGKFWLPEVGKATHYHATYVNPWWVRTMTKHSKLGIHIFYRPKRWGDGEEIPVWGDRLDVTGSITPMGPESDKEVSAKRVATQPAKLRSIFDPVEEIRPGG